MTLGDLMDSNDFNRECARRESIHDSSFYGPREYYVKGIAMLGELHENKGYRNYTEWFLILDELWQTSARYWNE